MRLLLLVSLFLTSLINLNAQSLDWEDYDPPSTLVVPENPVSRAKFPFIDIHSHQRNMDESRLNQLASEMDAMNMAIMVNLSGRGDKDVAQMMEIVG